MTTLKDVARKAGLSVTQVSRALNNHSDVSAETRALVQRVAKYLNYQPNLSARKLVSGRSGLVGLVVPFSADLASDGLFLEVVAGLSTQFSARKMQLVLHIAQDDEPVETVYNRLIGNGALDGFILTNPLDDDPRAALLNAAGVPFVVHGRIGPVAEHPYFDIDNEGIFYQQTRHLIALGHRRIAFMNGVEGRSFVTARARGHVRALTEAGLPVDPALMLWGEMTEAFGLVSTVALFTDKGTRPTAILTGNARIAKGVYQGLNALGLSIPQDISVMTHDDHLANLRTEALFPALTVSEAPLRDSWPALAECLIGALAGTEAAQLRRIGPHRFIYRASTAPPGGSQKR